MMFMFSEVLWQDCHNITRKNNQDATGTVDGRNPAHAEYPISFKVSCILGGAGFLPSMTCHEVYKFGC